MTRSACVFIQFAQLDQFRSDLAGRFNFRKIVHRRHVLVGQVVNDIKIVLQAILDQFADGGFIEDPAGGVMGIVERQRAALAARTGPAGRAAPLSR